MTRHFLVFVFSLLAIGLQENASAYNRYDPVARLVESLSPLGEEMWSSNAIHLRVLLEGNAVRILDEWT